MEMLWDLQIVNGKCKLQFIIPLHRITKHVIARSA